MIRYPYEKVPSVIYVPPVTDVYRIIRERTVKNNTSPHALAHAYGL
jgi:hypothetical protein